MKRFFRFLVQKLDDGSHGMTWMMVIVTMICSLIVVFVFRSAINDIRTAFGK